MKRLILFLAILSLGSSAFGYTAGSDSTPMASEKERLALEEATRALVVSGKDLRALEAALASFPPKLVEGLHTNAYRFGDPTRHAAYSALRDCYPADFLSEAMRSASEEAAYWAIQKLFYQATCCGGVDSPNSQRLAARKGMISDEVLMQFVPILKKLRVSKSERVRQETQYLIELTGLLMNREEVLKELEQEDEDKLCGVILRIFETVHVDPGLTARIWEILARAQTESHFEACLLYPWLFHIPIWDANKARLLTRAIESCSGSLGDWAGFVMASLAESDNPLASQILEGLAATGNESVKKQAAEYQEIYCKARLAAQH